MTALRSLDARTDRRLRLRVRGAVQGVGFRPFAYGLASRLALSGFVLNDADGVLIEVEGAGAEQFLHALRLAPPPGSALFIENVGNLVCPAAFDLGEAHKVVVLSATEGEDKPLKYPDMFAAADLLLLNKSDLLPHLDFDVGKCLGNALRVNPRLQTLIVSAKTGEGVAAFVAWIEASAARRAVDMAKG